MHPATHVPMRGLSMLTRLEAKVLFLRDPVALLVALAVPIGILLVFGLPGFARDPAPELGGQRPIDTVLPSIALAISVGVLAITVLPGYLAIYREKGDACAGCPPPRPARRCCSTAQVVVNLAMAVVALVLVLVIGAAWLGMAMPASLGWFVVAFVLGTSALFAVGLVIAAVSPTGKAANAIGMLVFFPSLFLAGALACPSDADAGPAQPHRRRHPARRLPRRRSRTPGSGRPRTRCT